MEEPASFSRAAGPASAPPKSVAQRRFGAFAGVYTPSVLTILGVVMYLRFGWVVGNAGLAGALVIVAVAHAISFATGLSVASIATNRTVGAGGAYFMISRSLGMPTGAAVGIPLFLGQALSVSFYIVGFSESLARLFPGVPQQEVSLGVCVVLTALSLKSTSLALRTQYIVMAMIAVSLVSFFTGRPANAPAELAWLPPAEHADFAEVFAIFFPAVTGIMAGVGMSGDLKDPRRAIPRGTLWAIGTGFAIYLAFPFWLASNAAPDALKNDPEIVWAIARIPALIYVGVWGATLSSALGSLVVAPRTLQALAQDRVLPRILGRGSGLSHEPRVGMVVTLAIAAVGIVLGDLNSIANVLTMFFLVTYGLTNLACGLERWAASPSFRPRFRVPAWVSLFGAGASFYVMSVIDPIAMTVALGICAVLYLVTQRRHLSTTFGDARHGIWAALVRTALLQLRRVEFHPSNWRPNLIIMGGAVSERGHLLELGSTIAQEQGIVTYFHLIRGTVEEKAKDRPALQRSMDEKFAAEYPNVFFRVDITANIYEGMVDAAQSYGVGSFEANTVMMGWLNTPDRAADYFATLRRLTALDRSLLLVHMIPNAGFQKYGRIQIWWGGLEGNGGLMLLLAFLITSDARWQAAEVEVITVVNNARDKEEAERGIAEVIDNARLRATSQVVLNEGGTPVQHIMRAHSYGADLAIIGLRPPEVGDDPDEYLARMNTILDALPTTVLVRSARNFKSEVLFQDEEERSSEVGEAGAGPEPSTLEDVHG